MSFLINDFWWMVWNIFLASLPILFAYLTIKYVRNIGGIIFFVLWLLFFPNTIYLITDLQYLPFMITVVSFPANLIVVFVYILLVFLGLFSYFCALKPMVGLVQNKFKIRGRKMTWLIYGFSFLVAFGVMLGKIERTQSWDVFLRPSEVVRDANVLLSKPIAVLIVFVFGVGINIIWRLGKDRVKDLPFRL